MNDDDKFAEHRSYQRYSIDFEAKIEGFDCSGDPFTDRAELRNISGGGVCMLCSHPQHYRDGQHLSLTIKLPDTDRLHASMRYSATVVWVRNVQLSDGSKSGLIGLKLGGDVEFESHESADGEEQ